MTFSFYHNLCRAGDGDLSGLGLILAAEGSRFVLVRISVGRGEISRYQCHVFFSLWELAIIMQWLENRGKQESLTAILAAEGSSFVLGRIGVGWGEFPDTNAMFSFPPWSLPSLCNDWKSGVSKKLLTAAQLNWNTKNSHTNAAERPSHTGCLFHD